MAYDAPAPRQPTVTSASADFYEACRERHGQSAQQDEAGLYRIAHLIGHALALMETEVSALDMARETVDRSGFALRAKPFRAADVDIDGLCQALFPECPLTSEAETLLKAMISDSLSIVGRAG